MTSKAVPTLLILLAIAAGASCRSTDPAARSGLQACVNTLGRIETAKRTLAMGHNLPQGTGLAPDQVNLLGDYMLGGWPLNQCPSGGKYTVGKTGVSPACSVHGDYKDLSW